MRKNYEKQLEEVHTRLIEMGALCEDAIASAANALLNEDEALRQKALGLELEIDGIERDIEHSCVRLLLQQQPIASDLRQVTAAQKMIYDMERIGDQAADIAEISAFMRGSSVKSDVNIADMARATSKMVTESIDSFVNRDLELAYFVIKYDDVVDGLFSDIKRELIEQLMRGGGHAEECLDLLMIAKYFERIGDHAVNIADWVVYFLTGSRSASNV
ncbi:MAG: phosphate signaling complex protein PhoU [Oscillospiraceae bacterium]|jgi:phosphate transport system protein|nr:phosphate signaling complex protein PhoU [Oscillospiraceae bacterium]